MLQLIQNNYGTIIAVCFVALLVFLAIRRMVLDKKAGIGACGQKCSQCAKMGHCDSEFEKTDAAPKKDFPAAECSGVCASCQYKDKCH